LNDLMLVDWNFKHVINKTAILHGYMMYFDAYFDGSDKSYVL